MFNIEKALKDTKILDVAPSEELVSKTKLECRKAMKIDRAVERKTSIRRMNYTVTLLTAAAAIALIFISLVVFTVGNRNSIRGAAYYTVDINPSFGFTVDEDNIVTEVTFQNEDAKSLYDKMNCVGMKVDDAMKLVILKAKEQGYIDESEGKYVLVGQFKKDNVNEKDQEVLDNLVAKLESVLGDSIRLIMVNGDQKDVKNADDIDVSPGILILCRLADDVDPDSNLKVDDVVKGLSDDVLGNYQDKVIFKAPQISVNVEDSSLVVSWNAIDFSKVGYDDAQVEYKLVKSTTLEEIKNLTNIVKVKKINIGDVQPTRFVVPITTDELNNKTYYCLFVICKNTLKKSNAVPITAKILDDLSDDEPLGEYAASDISGKLDGQTLRLSWTKIEDERLSGYKVMYSFSDATPVYGESGCQYLAYISDPSKTSGVYKLSSLKDYRAGKKCYFSITALYDDQKTKISGNVISMMMPGQADDNPQDSNDDGEYVSTSISGYLDGNIMHLSWGRIRHDDLDGYKVMYSFTDTRPVYGDGSNYVKWITTASTTSTSFNVKNLSGYEDGATCYFSITALYDDHKVREGGNVITAVMPGSQSDPSAEPYVSTSVSGSLSGYTMSLNWGQVNHEQFEGYKVVYSFTNSSPSYAQGSNYIRWITTASSTSASFNVEDLSGYEDGAICYFSITVLYDNHSVMKAGNAISATMPAAVTPTPTPEETPVETPEVTPEETPESSDDEIQ